MAHDKPKPAEQQNSNASEIDDAAADAAFIEAVAGAVETPSSKDQGEIESLREELAVAKDRELRVRAELDNYRKRSARELEDSLRYANMPLLRDLLPVLDNLVRTIEAAEKNHDTATLLEGVKMVLQHFEGALSRHDCKPIAAVHQPFDPNLHQAILQQPSAEFPANTVLMETQAGYVLRDRVVRPSQVIVSSAMPGSQNSPEESRK
jgi:molecular chaperone GrpE